MKSVKMADSALPNVGCDDGATCSVSLVGALAEGATPQLAAQCAARFVEFMNNAGLGSHDFGNGAHPFVGRGGFTAAARAFRGLIAFNAFAENDGRHCAGRGCPSHGHRGIERWDPRRFIVYIHYFPREY